MSQDTFASSPAYWQGLFQPIVAASDDPDDQKVAQAMLKARTKYSSREVVSFMVGWHEMLNTGVKLPKPAIETTKKADAKREPLGWYKPQTDEQRRFHVLRALHDVVRGALAPFGLQVDTTPRAPKRIGPDVNYYLVDYDDVPVEQFANMEEELNKVIKAFYPEGVERVYVDRGQLGNWPQKIVVVLARDGDLYRMTHDGRKKQEKA